MQDRGVQQKFATKSTSFHENTSKMDKASKGERV